MIKVKVIKPFNYQEGKELYVDEERFEELKNQGLVTKVEEKEIETTALYEGKIKNHQETKVIKTKK